MDGFQYDMVFFEGVVYGFGEVFGNFGVVGCEIVYLELVVFGVVFIDWCYEVVVVYEEGVFWQCVVFVVCMGWCEDCFDDGVVWVVDFVVLFVVCIVFELQEGGIKGCWFGVDYLVLNGYVIVFYGCFQWCFFVG